MISLVGKTVSAKIKEQVIEILESMDGYIPTAAIIRVGERPDDVAYETNAIKRMNAFGMKAELFHYPEDISEETFREEFKRINADEEIDGILMFRPLPEHMDEKWFERAIDPEKDLDGISPLNNAHIFAGMEDGFSPCTAEAVLDMLKVYEIPMEGKRVVVVGRSMVVGRPVSMLLLNENATVTICHKKTEKLREVCREADILVVAAGEAGLLDYTCLKQHAVVIDVGINVRENGKFCGDMVWEGLETAADAATPVPGGVGGVTTAILCKHLVRAAVKRRKKNLLN